MQSQLILICVGLSLSGAKASLASELGVTLYGQRAELVGEGNNATLLVSMTAKNHLAVPIDSVRVGVLWAQAPEQIEGADPAKLYRDGPQGGVGVIDEQVALSLKPGEEAPFALRAAVPPHSPQPRTFRTHVLGYNLAALSAPLLFDLLTTEAPADELAAVDALALWGDAAARARARARWGGDAALVQAFVDEATSGVQERPSEAQTFRRVYAVRALGVLGGDVARRALEQLLRDAEMSRFDEPLQVLRIARLRGTRLETPLAYVVPPHAARFFDLVTVALDDIDALAHQPLEEPTSEAMPAVSPLPQAVAPATPSAKPSTLAVRWRAWAGGALLAALVASLAYRRRTRSASSKEPSKEPTR